MREVLVRVSEQHITRGVPADCHGCPLALAITEATEEQWSVGTEFCWESEECANMQQLPQEAARFRRDFDGGGASAVKPLEFVVRLREAL